MYDLLRKAMYDFCKRKASYCSNRVIHIKFREDNVILWYENHKYLDYYHVFESIEEMIQNSGLPFKFVIRGNKRIITFKQKDIEVFVGYMQLMR